MGDRNGYARKISGDVLSFVDETVISWRDCYIPDFWRIIVIGELVVVLSDYVKYMDLIMKCMALWINVLVWDYRLLMKLKYTIKRLTFVNGNFCSEILTTRSLVQMT